MVQATGTEAVIYNAAMQRLPRHFTPAQCLVLANFMVAQSKHETANYTSDVFKNNKNAFGYKFYAKSDWQLKAGTQSPEGNAYACYNSVASSACEMADWLGRRADVFSKVSTPELYAIGLKNQSYYGDPVSNYINGMKHYFQNFSGAVAAAGSGIGLLAILVFFFIIKK